MYFFRGRKILGENTAVNWEMSFFGKKEIYCRKSTQRVKRQVTKLSPSTI
jgi:hypothetical protein